MTYVTCGLTACTPGSAPGSTLSNEYGKPLHFLYTVYKVMGYFQYSASLTRMATIGRSLAIIQTACTIDEHTSFKYDRLKSIEFNRRVSIKPKGPFTSLAQNRTSSVSTVAAIRMGLNRPSELLCFWFYFLLIFVSGPFARLSWPSRQLLSAR